MGNTKNYEKEKSVTLFSYTLNLLTQITQRFDRVLQLELTYFCNRNDTNNPNVLHA